MAVVLNAFPMHIVSRMQVHLPSTLALAMHQPWLRWERAPRWCARSEMCCIATAAAPESGAFDTVTVAVAVAVTRNAIPHTVRSHCVGQCSTIVRVTHAKHRMSGVCEPARQPEQYAMIAVLHSGYQIGALDALMGLQCGDLMMGYHCALA